MTSFTVPRTKAVSFSNVTLMSSLGKSRARLLPHGFQPLRAEAHGEIVEQAVAALLPDDQRVSPGRLAIHQNFLRVDGHRFDHLAVGHRNTLDVHRAVDDQALADGDHQFAAARRAPEPLPGAWAVIVAAGAAAGTFQSQTAAIASRILTISESRHLFDLRFRRISFPLGGPGDDLHHEGELPWAGRGATARHRNRRGARPARGRGISEGACGAFHRRRDAASAVPGVLAIS